MNNSLELSKTDPALIIPATKLVVPRPGARILGVVPLDSLLVDDLFLELLAGAVVPLDLTVFQDEHEKGLGINWDTQRLLARMFVGGDKPMELLVWSPVGKGNHFWEQIVRIPVEHLSV